MSPETIVVFWYPRTLHDASPDTDADQGYSQESKSSKRDQCMSTKAKGNVTTMA